MQKSNSRNMSRDACSICLKKFNGMFVSEHQCKRCMRYVCKECCNKKKNYFTNIFNNHINSKTGILKAQQHRACEKCVQSMEKLNNYTKMNQINFNTLCKIGKQWLQIIEIDKADVMEKQNKDKKIKKDLTANKISQIWLQCDESFRELLGLSLSKTSVTQANQSIGKMIEKSKYTSTSGHLAAYILCHCDQKSAFQVYEYLNAIKCSINLQNIIESITLLCQNSKQSNDPKIIKNLLNFTHKFGINFLETQSFFLKLLPVQIIGYFIHEVILSGASTVLELIISYVIFEYRDLILNEKFNQQEIKQTISQSIQLQKVDKGLKLIRKLITKKSFQGVKKKGTNQSLLDPKMIESEEKCEKIETKQETQNQNSDQILQKINKASEFLRKIEENEISEEDIDPGQMADLQKYLDLVITQNQQSLGEIDNLDYMLSGIQEQLYKTNQP